MAIGAGLGFVLSLTISSILFELSRGVWYVVLDVIILLAASVALFMKQFRAAKSLGEKAAPGVSFAAPEAWMLAVVRVGAACVAAAAISNIVVAATSLPAALKMVLMMNIAASHCYLLCLASVEVFNSSVNSGAPLVARQLYTVAISSLAVGCVSGFLFGAADVEAHYTRLGWEEWVAAALCILSGAAVGHANSVAVDDQMEIAFEPLPMEETAAGAPSAAASGSVDDDATVQ